MNHLVKRPGENIKFEFIDTNGLDDNPFAVDRAFCELVDDTSMDKAYLGKDYVIIVGDCSSLGDQKANFLLSGKTRVKELDNQVLYGNAIFCRYNVVDEWAIYTELTDEDLEAIEKAFSIRYAVLPEDEETIPVFDVATFHAAMDWI